MTWIYVIPAWLLLVVAIVTTSLVTAFSLRWFRRSRFHRADISHNDVAGPVVTTAGTILAVMLSFMVVTVWQQFDTSAANVQHEAASLSDLYSITFAIAPNVRAQVQTQTKAYLHTIINDEWPRMRLGQVSPNARHQLYTIFQTIAVYEPATPGQLQTRGAALKMVQQAIDARRRRIYDNQEGIPGILWFVMIVTSIITVAFIFYFRMRDEALHVLFTTGLAIVIVIVCILIAELDYPFRGDISIKPVSFQNSLSYIDSISKK